MKLEHLSTYEQRQVKRVWELQGGMDTEKQSFGDGTPSAGRELQILNEMLGRKGINPNKIKS